MRSLCSRTPLPLVTLARSASEGRRKTRIPSLALRVGVGFEMKPGVRSCWIALLALAMLIGPFSSAAVAHKLVVFATVNGKTLEGEAYFHGGAAVHNAKVTIVGPQERVLGETTTDDEGLFTFDVVWRCEHTLIVDAGEGHDGRYAVPIDELPDDLPLPNGQGSPTAEAGNAEPPPVEEPDLGSTPEPSLQGPALPSDAEDLGAQIKALSKQIAGMRKDLDRYRNQRGLQDVLGGIGYILGIMGLVFYFLGVRRKEKSRSDR